jgi:hypothetical protein
MKRHEACFHINTIINEMRYQRDWYAKTMTEDRITRNPDGTNRPSTLAEIESEDKFLKRQIAELDLQLDALDMAAEALTK